MTQTLQHKEPTVQQRLSTAIADPKIANRLSKSLSPGINQGQFLAQLQISLGDRKLKDCSYESLYNAAHFCATLGLLPSLQQIALIPREMRDRKTKQVYGVLCIPMPQWQGYKAIMERHPEVLEAEAFLVHANDQFAVQRDGVSGVRTVHHDYDPLDETRVFNGWNDVRGGYLEITYRDRSRPNKYHFTTAAHMKKSADCAETDKMWKAWFEKMLRKTVYRDAFSSRVVTIDVLTAEMLQMLNDADDQALGNDPERLQQPEPQQPAIAQRGSRAQQLADTMTDRDTIDGNWEPSRDPEPEEAPVEEPAKPKKSSKSKAPTPEPRSSEIPEGCPPYPKHLEPIVIEMCKAPDATVLQQIAGRVGPDDGDDFDTILAIGDWLRDSGQVSQADDPKQGEMFEKTEHSS